MKHLNVAYNAQIDAMAAKVRARIAPLERSIHLASDIGRAKLRITTAAILFNGDAHAKLTVQYAADALEDMFERYAAGEVNASEQRLVHTIFENRDAVKPILEAVIKAPAIDRFWRHEKKLNHGNFPTEIGLVATAKLRDLLAEHFATIPGVEDLLGKPQRGR